MLVLLWGYLTMHRVHKETARLEKLFDYHKDVNLRRFGLLCFSSNHIFRFVPQYKNLHRSLSGGPEMKIYFRYLYLI